ncbi:MAG TPA: hypothetical protein PKM73_19205 [Verrucomicrobiota bacterium]|nr:hypothetical protein [Verrucomicrobiota bacterium]HNU53070.1 hypothetical protein [Verrucomicrobiota bacterium]
MTEPRISIYKSPAPSPSSQETGSLAGEAARLAATADALIRSLAERLTSLATQLDAIRQQEKAHLDAQARDFNQVHDWILHQARARAETTSPLQANLDRLQAIAAHQTRALTESINNLDTASAQLEAAASQRTDTHQTYLAEIARSLRLASEGARGLGHDLTRWSAQSSLLADALERTARPMNDASAREENLAGCHALQLGDPTTAARHFQNALLHQPSPQCLDNLALAHLAAQRPADALRTLDDPRAATLPFATLQARRSRTALDSADPARSLEEAEAGLRADPDNAPLLRLAATAALAMGRAATALRHLRRLCALSPNGGAPLAPNTEPEALLAHRLVRLAKTVRDDCR